MLKKVLILSFCTIIPSCTSFYETGGTTPVDLLNPTLVEQYIEHGAFFNSSRMEQRSYSQFAREKCIENGYRNGYEGYALTKGYTSGIIPFTDGHKTMQIWCDKTLI